MILDLASITEILRENPSRVRIEKGREYSRKLRRHIYGEKLQTHLETIDGFERESLKAVRAKYTKSNKDLFSRLARPLDKVFSARGGSTYYNLSEGGEAKARVLSQNVRDGHSIRKWIELFWKPHMLDDPFGIILLEILPQTQATLSLQRGQSAVYPTYISIHDIFDYLPKGNRLEYLALKLSEQQKTSYGLKADEQIFRVIDDASDYLVRLEGDSVTILGQGLTIPNFFGEVPAMINSDFIDPQTSDCFLSLYDDVIELAEHFLLKGSIKITHDFMHGFPKYSEFASDCPDCKGNGVLNGEDCKNCNGSGKKAMIRVSDVKLLNWPTKEDQVILPNQVGGYVSPDKTFYEISTADLQMLENVMNVTLWGTQSKVKTEGMSIAANGDTTKTATEIIDETKPQADRLVPISEMAEKRHKFLLDMIIRLQIAPGYSGSSVNYGRRYLLESPDSIWDKYSDARVKGAPQSVLDTLLNEYYEANYQSDPVGLELAKKLMYVEPFVHLTSIQLKALTPDPVDYKMKLYFSEWLALQNESMLLVSDVSALKESLSVFVSQKQLPDPQQQNRPAA
jgi:hypothetical protein